MLFRLLFSALYLFFSIWTLVFYVLILCGFEFWTVWIIFWLWLIDDYGWLCLIFDLCPLHYFICIDTHELWLFDVAKGGEKWVVEKLRKSLEIKWSSIPKHRGSERAIYYAYTLLACILISGLILSSSKMGRWRYMTL